MCLIKNIEVKHIDMTNAVRCVCVWGGGGLKIEW